MDKQTVNEINRMRTAADTSRRQRSNALIVLASVCVLLATTLTIVLVAVEQNTGAVSATMRKTLAAAGAPQKGSREPLPSDEHWIRVHEWTGLQEGALVAHVLVHTKEPRQARSHNVWLLLPDDKGLAITTDGGMHTPYRAEANETWTFLNSDDSPAHSIAYAMSCHPANGTWSDCEGLVSVTGFPDGSTPTRAMLGLGMKMRGSPQFSAITPLAEDRRVASPCNIYYCRSLIADEQ